MIYDTENIFSCKLPDFASLSPGANLIGLTPIRSWSGLSQFSERHLDYASSGAVYDPFSAKGLDLYYLYGKQICSDHRHHIRQHQQWRTARFEAMLYHRSTTRKEFGIALRLQGVIQESRPRGRRGLYWVGPLQSLALRSPGKHSRMFLADEEVKGPLLSMRMDMDEATGRVFLWGWCGEARTEIFVGGLA